MDVFLESDTDEEDCLIDQNVTQKEKRFIQDLNNLDHADELCFETHSNGFESQTGKSSKCVNVTSKNLVDLESISPSANTEEARRGHMVRRIGESLDPRHICLDCGKHYDQTPQILLHRKLHVACKFCREKFIGKRALANHVRTHTGERPFRCPRCGHGFMSDGAMRYHKKRCSDV